MNSCYVGMGRGDHTSSLTACHGLTWGAHSASHMNKRGPCVMCMLCVCYMIQIYRRIYIRIHIHINAYNEYRIRHSQERDELTQDCCCVLNALQLPEEHEQQFVMAVFNIGLKNSSPKVGLH